MQLVSENFITMAILAIIDKILKYPAEDLIHFIRGF